MPRPCHPMLALFLVAAAPVALADGHQRPLDPGADAEAGYADNLQNTPSGREASTSAWLGAGVHGRRLWRIGTHGGAVAKLEARSQAWASYAGLGQVHLAATVAYLHRLGDGFLAPTVSVGGSAAWNEFDSRLRDGADYGAKVLWIQPLNTAFQARVSARLDWTEAAHAAFDRVGVTGGVNIDWTLPSRWVVTAGLAQYLGDITSVLSGNYYVPTRFESSVTDDVYEYQGLPSTAYRYDASVLRFRLGLNVPLGPTYALDASAGLASGDPDHGPAYTRSRLAVALLARF